MARILRGDYPMLAGRIASVGRWRELRVFLEHASDGRDAKMEAGPGKDLRDLHFSQHWTKGLQLLDHIPHEIRILVHRLGQLDQGIPTCSSTRLSQEAMVSAVTRNALAVCSKDQLRAARS